MKLTALHLQRFARLELARPLRAEQPPVLVEAQAACANIVNNRQMFPTLGNGRGQRRFLFTCRNRERRVERLEKIAKLGAVLFAHTDLLSLRDGQTKRDGSCAPLTERQLGREAGIVCGDRIHHDSQGMRALRSALRDMQDGALIERSQPRVQYCSNCNDEIRIKGASCTCGRRERWRWRAYATIIRVTKKFFEALGLLEALEAAQEKAYERKREGIEGPDPIIDIRAERDRRRIIRAQAMAAKRARLTTNHNPDLVEQMKQQLERIARRRQE